MVPYFLFKSGYFSIKVMILLRRNENNVMDFVKKYYEKKISKQKISNCPFFKLVISSLAKANVCVS